MNVNNEVDNDVKYAGKIIKWSEIIRSTECVCSCGRYITNGYYKNIVKDTDIMSLNVPVCVNCYNKMKDSVKLLYVTFTTKQISIDSAYIRTIDIYPMCLQSYPCKHTTYVVLRNFYSEEDMEKYLEKGYSYKDDNVFLSIKEHMHTISNLTDGITIFKLLLLLGKTQQLGNEHFNKYSSKVPEVKPGDVVTLSNTISIAVNKSFIDPRYL